MSDCQLANINLAQAIYKDTDTYVLDDPLFMDFSLWIRTSVDISLTSAFAVFKGKSGTEQQNDHIVTNKKTFEILLFSYVCRVSRKQLLMFSNFTLNNLIFIDLLMNFFDYKSSWTISERVQLRYVTVIIIAKIC